jgi:hypothetical protein
MRIPNPSSRGCRQVPVKSRARTSARYWPELGVVGSERRVLGGLSANRKLADYLRVARNPSGIPGATAQNRLLATPSVPQLCARQPHRVTEPFAFTFLIRLDRHRAPASCVSIHNPRQLDPGNSPGRNCFGGECRERHAHRRFRRSPQKSSHRKACLDVSRR